MTLEEAMGSPFEVLADNWAAVLVFESLMTQWRVGAVGATGLDYSAIPFVLRLRGIPRKEWPELFDDIRTMEEVALKEFARLRDQNR